METMLIAGMWLHLFGAHDPGAVENFQIREPLQSRPGSHRSSNQAVSLQLFRRGSASPKASRISPCLPPKEPRK